MDNQDVKADLFRVLRTAPEEIPYLCQALEEGRVNGRSYHGRCACLIGTLANGRLERCPELLQGKDEWKAQLRVVNDLKPDVHSPIEQWFLTIRPDQTPDNSDQVRLTLTWIAEFVAKEGSVVSKA